MSSAIQFFYKIDLTDPKAHFVVRQGDPLKPWLLQSHGWLDGALVQGTMQEATEKFLANDTTTWPLVTPKPDLLFVDRYGKKVTTAPIQVTLERLRPPASDPPSLSVVFVRWGGKHRIGEDTSEEDLATDGGWGKFGSPPADWYMDAIVNLGIMKHPNMASPEGSAANCEVLSLFLSSDNDMKALAKDATIACAALGGIKKAGFWMLWPADWDADWKGAGFEAYVERRILSSTMHACEAAGLRSSFPHPADLYMFITSKAWMGTLSPEPKARLPACVLVDRKAIEQDAGKAATAAMKGIEALRPTSVFAAGGGPAAINKNGVKKGVVKIGWSWEAKYVWFWNNPGELKTCLAEMIRLPGCLSEQCIVQEWVDFDVEVRLFFFPPSDWDGLTVLKPAHYEYTAWNTSASSTEPGSFTKPKRANVLKKWANDEEALLSAHAQAEEASQFLIAHLLSVHPTPVPKIRMDFMIKRWGPGHAQVAFGEYCEVGACCLQWNEGPPTVWRACLDYALK